MKQKEITHVCIAMNVFALMQYLLNQPTSIIVDHTYYFLCSGIPQSIRKQFKHVTEIDTLPVTGKALLKRRFQKLYLALFAHQRYPFLKTARIYAQDFQYAAAVLIKKRDYTLLSDSQFFFSNQMNPGQPEMERLERLKQRFSSKIASLIYGNLTVNQLGTSPQCKTILLAQENSAPILNQKRVILKTFASLWNEADNEKRSLILRLFDCNEEDVKMFLNVDTLILTQPFFNDGALTEEENFTLYKTIVENANGNVMLKVHPRDTFDYSHYFPNTLVYQKPIPMELLALVGVKLTEVITLFSSSVYCFDNSVKVTWLGSSIHPKLEKFYGKF